MLRCASVPLCSCASRPPCQSSSHPRQLPTWERSSGRECRLPVLSTSRELLWARRQARGPERSSSSLSRQPVIASSGLVPPPQRQRTGLRISHFNLPSTPKVARACFCSRCLPTGRTDVISDSRARTTDAEPLFWTFSTNLTQPSERSHRNTPRRRSPGCHVFFLSYRPLVVVH